ncbi:Ammonia channel precursor [Rubripirellula tenax]|uniref:Ammonium transporter n=1 Tax=Rubripirellula tenax TaxID=2528015 RepID=A0A5C6F4X0_9BACT|nr:ammonium transporter [Rubripirellula tenax]TWU56803.1 Ammonia channel precursor [Rubripirellula tenax]
MFTRILKSRFQLFLLLFLALSSSAYGADESVLNSGDTAWILMATGLVLFMTIPALALFYAGLVRSKNVLSIFMQCLSLTAVMSILWIVCGYSLAFDTTGMEKDVVNLHSFIGGFGKVMMKGVTVDSMHGTIPEVLFAAFQMTFAVITPALIVGAFAERMKFSAMLAFSVLWLLVVYCPICHMTWAGDGGLYADWGVKDFAGGIVVHVTAGFAALVACLVIGPRLGYPTHLEPPHNLTMTLLGTAMLWFGWFGFNGGSQLAADGTAAMAVFVTHISASVATIVWMGIEWFKLGKPSVLGAATGAIAGLAAITPASGTVGPIGAMAIGATSGAVCFLFATKIKQRLRYDDTLDVFGVHGVGGFLGTIMCGVFAAKQFGGSGIEGGILNQVTVQLLAAVSCAIYAIIATYVILRLVQFTIGLRIDAQGEIRGLDLTEHEERGYVG